MELPLGILLVSLCVSGVSAVRSSDKETICWLHVWVEGPDWADVRCEGHWNSSTRHVRRCQQSLLTTSCVLFLCFVVDRHVACVVAFCCMMLCIAQSSRHVVSVYLSVCFYFTVLLMFFGFLQQLAVISKLLLHLTMLVVRRTRSSFGDRTFAATGPQVWNSLPPNLRLYGQFRRLLKTFLFRQWDHGGVWTVLTVMMRNILTYVLSKMLFLRLCVCL